MNYIDLVADSGELIRIECPDEHYDACMDSIGNAMRRGDWWCPAMFEGCKAEYLGLGMGRVSMKKVVGTL